MQTPLRRMLVTNALPYANGPLHLGHLTGAIQSDIWVRFQKMSGHDCLFVCGSDSHGTPIMIQAEKEGLTPEALIKNIQAQQSQDFADFLIDFDHYHTTHSVENQELVELIFNRHNKNGHIYKKTIKQLFDPIKNIFLPDRYIKGICPRCQSKDQYGDNCENCGATYSPADLIDPYSTLSGAIPIEKESVHYFFDLQHFESFLKNWTRQDHLQPQVTHKLEEWFKEGLKSWDISRDAPYFGFLLPGEKDKYFYVWLDAPVGYIACFKHLCAQRKNLNFADYWEDPNSTELYHFIGKDIIYFHALFWPALLQGADFRTPTAIFVNGFLTIEGQKMSKSRGTFIKARTYLEHLHPEYLRYYLAAKMSHKIEDLDLNFTDFMQRVNADLVGKYINIASRCAPFIHKYFDNQLSAQLSDASLFQAFSAAGDDIGTYWQQLDYSHAIRAIMALADRANEYINEKKPWQLIKLPEQSSTVQEICTLGLNLFRVLTIYLKPVLPELAKKVEHFLNIDPLRWQEKDTLLLNHTVNEFKPLMQRIELESIQLIKQPSGYGQTQSS